MTEERAKGISITMVVAGIIIALIIGAAVGYFMAPAPPAVVGPGITTTVAGPTVTTTATVAGPTVTTTVALPAERPFEGITIDYVSGATGCPFTAVMVKGAEDAAKLLGCKLNIIYGEWDPEKMVSALRESIARRPDGIIVMGHTGDEAVLDLIEEAFGLGIIVTAGNVDLPKNREKYMGKGFGYTGSDLYQHGVSLATLSLKRFDLKPGDRVAIISGVWEQPVRNLRPIGVEDAFKEAGLIADRIVGELAVQTDPDVALRYITGYYAAHPDVKLIAYDGGIILGGSEKYMKALGKEPGEIYNVGFDLMPAVIDGIEKDYVQFSMDQQPYLQGFIPVIDLCLAIKYSFQGLYVDTGAAYIDKTNVALVKELVAEKIRG